MHALCNSTRPCVSDACPHFGGGIRSSSIPEGVLGSNLELGFFLDTMPLKVFFLAPLGPEPGTMIIGEGFGGGWQGSTKPNTSFFYLKATERLVVVVGPNTCTRETPQSPPVVGFAIAQGVKFGVESLFSLDRTFCPTRISP